jgi:hypothetical protein
MLRHSPKGIKALRAAFGEVRSGGQAVLQTQESVLPMNMHVWCLNSTSDPQTLNLKPYVICCLQVYPDPVRVVAIGKTVDQLLSAPEAQDNMASSVEFCGGTHLKNTAQVRRQEGMLQERLLGPLSPTHVVRSTSAAAACRQEACSGYCYHGLWLLHIVKLAPFCCTVNQPPHPPHTHRPRHSRC